MHAVRILLLAHKPPWPPVDGGTLAAWAMAEGLARAGHDVRVLACSTPKHPALAQGPAPAGIAQTCVAVDTRRLAAALGHTLRQGLPLSVARYVSAALRAALRDELRVFDPHLVQLEGLSSALAVDDVRRHAPRARVILRAHNVEAELGRQAVRRAGLARPFRRAEARRIDAFERASWRAVDGVVAISEPVAEAVRAACATPVVTIPVGVEVGDGPAPQPAEVDFFHLGAMDWAPNRDGVAWLLREVWPRVRAVDRGARLHLAGRALANDGAQRRVPGVTLHGEVADAAAFVRAHVALVVPVHAGSGLRVKLVEALALGRAIVSTTRGAEGSQTRDGAELLLADTADAFAARLLRLRREPGLGTALGQAAWRHAREHFERGALMQRLVRFYDALAPR